MDERGVARHHGEHIEDGASGRTPPVRPERQIQRITSLVHGEKEHPTNVSHCGKEHGLQHRSVSDGIRATIGMIT